MPSTVKTPSPTVSVTNSRMSSGRFRRVPASALRMYMRKNRKSEVSSATIAHSGCKNTVGGNLPIIMSRTMPPPTAVTNPSTVVPNTSI